MVCQSFRCCTLAHSRAALRITVVGIPNTLNTGSSLEEILTRCQPDQQSHYLVCQNDQESKVCKYPYLRHFILMTSCTTETESVLVECRKLDNWIIVVAFGQWRRRLSADDRA